VRRGDDLDAAAGEWPASGAWATVAGGVPRLHMPRLHLRSWFGCAAVAARAGLIGRGGLRLAIWLQARHSSDGPDSGSRGYVPFRHEGLDDMLDHYRHCHKNKGTGESLSRETAYRDLKQLRAAGLLEQVRRPTNDGGGTAVYRIVLRADSPVIGRLPAGLAKALRIAELARMMGELEIPLYTVPKGPGLADVVEAYASTVELEGKSPEQVRELSALEVAAIHARTPEQQAAVQRRVESLEKAWADEDGRPAAEPPQRPQLPAPREGWTFAPRDGSLGKSLKPLALVKRVLFFGCHTTPIPTSGPVTSGLSLGASRDFSGLEPHGKTKNQIAPTARNINGPRSVEASDGGSDLGRSRPGRASLLWERYGPDDEERDAAAQLRRQIWAMIRGRRPRQMDLVGGEWVEAEGVSDWLPAAGQWADLEALFGLVMVRTDREFVVDQAAAAVTETARNPVRVLCHRLWPFVTSLAPVRDALDYSSPAGRVQDQADLPARDQGDLHRKHVAEITRRGRGEPVPAPAESPGFRQALAELQRTQLEKDRRLQEAMAEVSRRDQLLHERYGAPLEPLSQRRIQAPEEPAPEPDSYTRQVLSESERRAAESVRYGAARARAKMEKRARNLLTTWEPPAEPAEQSSPADDVAELPTPQPAAAAEPKLQQTSPADDVAGESLAERLAARCLGARRNPEAPVPAERPELQLAPRSGSTISYHHGAPPPVDRLAQLGAADVAELQHQSRGEVPPAGPQTHPAG
jgi:hypothetical protein